ncbi:50S ribosomal protein L16 [Nanoarchaeota archaeon]
MARIRNFNAYRSIERPYTRISKYRAKSYVRARPVCRVVRFDMGKLSGEFEHTVKLKSKSDLQIRDNALESARQVANRLIIKNAGKQGFRMRIRVYPHHILRENPLASGAGADRMSTGMKKSFGKPIGIAAQIKKGQTIMELSVDKLHLDVAKEAMKRAGSKLPCGINVKVVDNKVAEVKKVVADKVVDNKVAAE